ncbi:hypothetical protein FP2506_15589 [Fulvimarina pelagi HTCC2506]|uniref:Uncharacterized protein n=2 Tax=Fulvimarina pelagi TaxID=217511 RepID=Q0G3G2_9HYPH|nr:hypothetical protein FP2506_15589 [Fulvimarina pelagi HTCC2506]
MARMAIDAEREAEFDAALAGLPCFAGGVDERYAPLLPKSFVLAGNYLKSFPQHGFSLSNTVRTEENYLLSPTCCYPVFHGKTGARLAKRTLITHKNLCFRCEDHYREGTRQIAFMMREYILFASTADEASAWTVRVKEEVAGLLRGMGLSVAVEAATDPFFNAKDYKQKFQEDQNLKSEFVIGGIAVGSVNLHLRAFSKACDILTETGEPLYSACFGLGYDRLAHQLSLASAAVAPSKEPSYV